MKTSIQSAESETITKIFSTVNLTKVQLDFITKHFSIVEVNKGDILLYQNERIQHQYYVINGCLRTYHTDELGKEHTIQFAIKDWWISDYIAYFGNEKTVHQIACIKKAIVYKIHKEALETIFQQIPEIEGFFRKKMEKALVRHEKRILANLTKTAKERYLSFLKMYPSIEKHLKNYHIASYLGITTESLSRIRKEIANT